MEISLPFSRFIPPFNTGFPLTQTIPPRINVCNRDREKSGNWSTRYLSRRWLSVKSNFKL